MYRTVIWFDNLPKANSDTMVGLTANKYLLTELFSIPKTQIVSNRSASFQEVMKSLTDEVNNVDILLTSLSD